MEASKDSGSNNTIIEGNVIRDNYLNEQPHHDMKKRVEGMKNKEEKMNKEKKEKVIKQLREVEKRIRNSATEEIAGIVCIGMGRGKYVALHMAHCDLDFLTTMIAEILGYALSEGHERIIVWAVDMKLGGKLSKAMKALA